eukprot:TRINITY_DN6175_c0_g1_i5.p1 TRINITY_DN6175_c0_g1~~TRINITY_DN6175_c0_g1_i5.p1  ORF type:complete len:151 (+),score=22.96 TRINITY_DN6175_c0_g1_i5:217-669(+)
MRSCLEGQSYNTLPVELVLRELFMIHHEALLEPPWQLRNGGNGGISAAHVGHSTHNHRNHKQGRLAPHGQHASMDPAHFNPLRDHPVLRQRTEAQCGASGFFRIKEGSPCKTPSRSPYSALIPVSYTHLTLPTKRIVEISVGAVSFKKKK